MNTISRYPSKFLTYAAIVALLSTIPILSSFSGNGEVAEKHSRMCLDVKQAAEKFKAASFALLKGTISHDSLKYALNDARNEYKKAEFLINFYYPDYVEGHLNGAPLFHIKRDDSRASVVPPLGLQKLDELVYSDELEESKREIAQLAQQYYNSLAKLMSDFSTKAPSKTELLAALRQQVITIFTLGVTGFDTPGSARGIDESAVSLASMAEYSSLVFKDAELASLFTSAASYLTAHRNFDSFDRLAFLKEYIDPLYAALQQIKQKHAIKDLNRPSALNPNAISLFAKEFLDPYYFTELEKKNDGAEMQALGKKLFYDPNLSFGSELSCASCHNPEKGFTDGQPKSLSNAEGKTVERNAPTLLNAVYADRYFYDLRAFTLEQQAEHVIFNNLEFNTAYAQIVENIKNEKSYKNLLEGAFGDKNIDRQRLTAAMTSYVLSLQSFNSAFDKYVRGELADIDIQVKDGFNLFMGKAACGTCHFAPTFAGLVPPQFQKSESEILGVLEKPIGLKPELDKDNGRNDNSVSNEQAWIYNRSFKTSTIRNVALTAPYFHNGAYKSLEQVLDFYNSGGGAGMGLDVENQTLSDEKLNLNPLEIQAIIAFMNSLTDNPYAAYENP